MEKLTSAIALAAIMLVAIPQCSNSRYEGRESTWLDIYRKKMKDPDQKIGEYKNIYDGDESLAGIEVYQFPIGDNAMETYDHYIGKHPGTIVYHFWDGRIREMGFSPEGTVTGEAWFSHDQGEDPEYYMSWEMVDFSKGSDPDFKKHKDPRKIPGYGLFP